MEVRNIASQRVLTSALKRIELSEKADQASGELVLNSAENI